MVALRGPDPSETRITLDGQPLNDASTGDFDLATFPTTLLAAIDVSEGLGAEDARGADTIGGEINLVSLRPTATPQHSARFGVGSFGGSELALSATGRSGRLGYALAAGDQQRAGYVRAYPARFSLPDGAGGTVDATTALGSASSSRTALANLSYEFSPRAALRLRVLERGRRAPARRVAQRADRPGRGRPRRAVQRQRAGNGSARSARHAGQPDGAAGGRLAGRERRVLQLDPRHRAALRRRCAYPVRLRADRPAGHRHAGVDAGPGTRTLALGAQLRGESLDSPDQGFAGALRQHAAQAVAAGRHAELGPRLRLGASLVESRWSTFAPSLDGRLGLELSGVAGGTLRLAAGTGFRAPLLAEQALLPAAALAADGNCVAAQGNPHERAEHATEYELGYGRRFGPTTLDATVYRTNLRDPIENFYPLGAACAQPGVSEVDFLSYPVNVGSVVYRGGALRLAHRFGGGWSASAEYALNAAYPTSLPDTVSAANPTSGSILVVGQQFAGIPLQQYAVGLRYARAGTHAALALAGKGRNNELNQGGFATLDGAVGRSFGRTDLTLAATNLTGAVAGRFTRLGAGTAYATPGGPVARDALVLEPAALRLILTLR